MAVESNKKYVITGEQLEDLANRLGGINANAEAAEAKAEEVESSLSNKVDKETGKGLSTNDFTNSDKSKLDSIESNAQENTIESVSVNGTEVTPDANKNVDINVPAIENSLTSESITDALSAAQGKALKELIDNAGGIKTLTSADYNYPTNNPNSIALYNLEPGFYSIEGPCNVRYGNANGSVSSMFRKSAIVYPGYSDGFKTIIYGSSGNYVLYNQYSAGSGSEIGKIGTIYDALDSTDNEKSLSAKQGKVLKDLIDNIEPISGSEAPTTSTEGTLGQDYIDTTTGDKYYLSEIDDTTTPSTYTWTKYTTGTGVNVVQTTGTSTTDVMSQNAVTKMIFPNDPVAGNNMNIVIGNAASYTGAAQPNNIAIGVGISTQDKTQAAGQGSIAIGKNALATSRKDASITALTGSSHIAIGEEATVVGSGYSKIAIGNSAHARLTGGIALGAYSSATQQGEMNIGSTSTGHGYNSSNYRLLTGLYPGQSEHDAATVGQLPDAPDSADFNALFD